MLANTFKNCSFFLAAALVVLTTAAALSLTNCKRGETPPPATKPAGENAPARNVVLVVPGLGQDRTAPLVFLAMQAQPDAIVASFGNNGQLAPLKEWATKSEYGEMAVLAFSMGCDRACRDAPSLQRLRLLILVDPVCMTMGKTEIELPVGPRILVFRRTYPGLEVQAKLVGAPYEEYPVAAFHNDMPADPGVLGISQTALLRAFNNEGVK